MANIKEGPTKKHRGIPEAVFLSDVGEYIKKDPSRNSETVLAQLDEHYQKYRFMESNLAQKRARLEAQIPDIQATMDAIQFLKTKKNSNSSIESQFLLSDQVFITADVPATEKVCLWLGANVMLEYDIEEADKLLTTNFSNAEKNLDEIADDLDFLRDQITTSEVNMARVYNWDVKNRQATKTVKS